MDAWFVADPMFYGVAVPAVLLLGIGKSGFGSGLGSVAVPMMALVVTVPTAAAMLMPVLLFLDILGYRAYRKDFDKEFLKFLIPCSLIGVFLGFLSFKTLDEKWVSGLVGFFTLLFLLQRMVWPNVKFFSKPSRSTGAVFTILSGFTSFLAHAGGPAINAYLLPLKMPPVRFAATLSVLFAVVNFAKWIPYACLGLLDTKNMMISVSLLPFAPIGVWLGVHWAKTMKPDLFYRLVHLGMLLTGCKLMWDALA